MEKPSAKPAAKPQVAKKATVKKTAEPTDSTDKSVKKTEKNVEKSAEKSTEKSVKKSAKSSEKSGETVEPDVPARQRPATPLDIAMAKYAESGWKVIKPPKGSLNDFVASRGPRFHFVQVVTKKTIEDQKYHGESKNGFVQNAFSNGATPIFAHVVDGSKPKVTFEDVNTGNRAIVSARKKESE